MEGIVINIKEIMQLAVKHKISDIHISVGNPVCFRCNGLLRFFDEPEVQLEYGAPVEEGSILTPQDTEQMRFIV